MVASPVPGSTSHECIAVACRSNAILWWFECTSNGIFHPRVAQGRDIVTMQGNAELKKDLTGQKHVWILDMQVDDKLDRTGGSQVFYQKHPLGHFHRVCFGYYMRLSWGMPYPTCLKNTWASTRYNLGNDPLRLKIYQGYVNFIIDKENTLYSRRVATAIKKVGLAYVFYDPHGTCKTSCARIFAATLNCHSLEHSRSSGVCSSYLAQTIDYCNARKIGCTKTYSIKVTWISKG
eukprot:Gb_02534 [translate_table: standard]